MIFVFLTQRWYISSKLLWFEFIFQLCISSKKRILFTYSLFTKCTHRIYKWTIYCAASLKYLRALLASNNDLIHECTICALRFKLSYFIRSKLIKSCRRLLSSFKRKLSYYFWCLAIRVTGVSFLTSWCSLPGDRSYISPK